MEAHPLQFTEADYAELYAALLTKKLILSRGKANSQFLRRYRQQIDRLLNALGKNGTAAAASGIAPAAA